MHYRRIPKDLLYVELATGNKREQERPHLRFRDVCKRDLKSVDINVEWWEELASDRDRWRQEVRAGLISSEAKQRQAAEDRPVRRKH